MNNCQEVTFCFETQAFCCGMHSAASFTRQGHTCFFFFLLFVLACMADQLKGRTLEEVFSALYINVFSKRSIKQHIKKIQKTRFALISQLDYKMKMPCRITSLLLLPCLLVMCPIIPWLQSIDFEHLCSHSWC